jgi:hypothetical protein
MSSLRVVELMKGADAAVCAAGANALYYHSAINGKPDEVVKAGGIGALVAALNAHLGAKEVCRGVARALGCLADGSEERGNAIVKAGAVPLLAAAHKNHKDWHQEMALGVLGYTQDGKKK